MSTDTTTSPNTTKPPRPDSKPTVPIGDELNDFNLNKLDTEIERSIKAIRNASESQRAILTALVAADGDYLTTTEIANRIFYTAGSVYNVSDGPLADANLIEEDEDDGTTVYRATALGQSALDHLDRLFSIDMSVLLTDYYQDPAAEGEPPSDSTADTDADADAEDDEIPAEAFSCDICGWYDENRFAVQQHITQSATDGHEGKSGTNPDLINEPKAKTQAQSADESGDIDAALDRLDQTMENAPDGNEDGIPSPSSSSSSASPASQKRKSRNGKRSSPKTESQSNSDSQSSNGSGGWQTWTERPAHSWGVDDPVEFEDLDELLDILHDEIGKMASRVEQDKLNNLNRETTRSQQLSSLAQAIEAYMGAKKTQAEIATLQSGDG